MPYRRIGNIIWYKKLGYWHIKQKCKDIDAAKSAMHLLLGIEHGWRPTKINVSR